MIEPWKAEQIDKARRHLVARITREAKDRMDKQSAKEQLAEAMAAGRAPVDLPEAADVSVAGVMR